MFLNLKAFAITDTELKLIANAAIIGESNNPNIGYKTPAAIGTPNTLYTKAKNKFCFIFFANGFEKFNCLIAGHFTADNFFVAGDDFFHALFNGFKVFWRKGFFTCKIIIKAVINSRANCYLCIRPKFFYGFGQDMSRIMT